MTATDHPTTGGPHEGGFDLAGPLAYLTRVGATPESCTHRDTAPGLAWCLQLRHELTAPEASELLAICARHLDTGGVR